MSCTFGLCGINAVWTLTLYFIGQKKNLITGLCRTGEQCDSVTQQETQHLEPKHRRVWTTATSSAAFQNLNAQRDADLWPHPSTEQVHSCNQTLKTFPELKIPPPPSPPTSTTSNFLQLQADMAAPPLLDGPLQRWAQEATSWGETWRLRGGSPLGGGGAGLYICGEKKRKSSSVQSPDQI